MVEVRYSSQLGNRLFQYCFGRILAEDLGYQLVANPIPAFPGTDFQVSGKVIESPQWACPERVNLKALLADRTPRRILVRRYMQEYRYYRPYREKIRNWIALAPSQIRPEPDAMVIHVRLGDYQYPGWVLSPDYYHRIIAGEGFSRLYIVTDEPDSPYFESFARYQPTMVTGSPIGSLRFIRSARRIVLSQSTYGWWGAYLSEAERIYFPLTRRSLWSPRSTVDLRVDEARYRYVTGVETLPRSIQKAIPSAIDAHLY